MEFRALFLFVSPTICCFFWLMLVLTSNIASARSNGKPVPNRWFHPTPARDIIRMPDNKVFNHGQKMGIRPPPWKKQSNNRLFDRKRPLPAVELDVDAGSRSDVSVLDLLSRYPGVDEIHFKVNNIQDDNSISQVLEPNYYEPLTKRPSVLAPNQEDVDWAGQGINKDFDPIEPFWGPPITPSTPPSFQLDYVERELPTSPCTTPPSTQITEKQTEATTRPSFEQKSWEKSIATRNDYPEHLPAPSHNYHAQYVPVVNKLTHQQVDFTPLFLALIPLALVIGAAASFALATAVRPNQAVALAQQQQQQQESSSNNNNNNNDMSILETLALINNFGSSFEQDNPFIIIVNGTAASTVKRRRRRASFGPATL